MKVKLLVLLVLGAVASGTTSWTAKVSNESNDASPSVKSASPVNKSFCCGFCIPGEPCEFCDLKKKPAGNAIAGLQSPSGSKADKKNCCGFCVPGEFCEFCDLKKKAAAASAKSPTE